ncbi:acyltransferase family protein [Rhodobacterales bacterium HKCCE2091]|nr:acyltransferase family protein [Rhodobacterales bacterium HKCCE2091]
MDYRPEIDGLRAVAVVPVILFHAEVAAFSGGFVGVDVFFVISGFLITSIIVSDLDAGRFTLAGFYERRARRILPALTVVTLATIPAAWVLMLPHQFEDFGKSVIAVALFASNFQMWWEAGYFGGAAELKPLLHTWSLAVEEQYYLLFPPLMLLVWRRGRRMTMATLSALALASLVLCEVTRPAAPDAAFFLAPFRAWELLAGALAALAARGAAASGRDLPALAGCGMIALAVLGFDETTPAPGLVSGLPVLGTVLVLVWARRGTWAARALSAGPLVWLGLVSYSAYLWHQPLFVFARLAHVGAPPAWVMAGLAVASIGLAWLTWRFVEQPFRRSGAGRLISRRGVFAASAAAGAVLIAGGAGLDNRGYAERRLSEGSAAVLAYTRFNETPAFDAAYRAPSCYFDPGRIGLDEIDRDTCHRPEPGRRNVMILGDSHGAHLWHGFSEVFPEVRFLQANAAGCRPLIPPSGTEPCRALLDLAWNEVLLAGGIDAVILAGRWIEEDVARIAGTVAALRAMGFDVYVAGPVPEYEAALPVVLSRTGTGPDRDSLAGRYLDRDRIAMGEAIAAEARAAGATYLDMISALCGPASCVTMAGDGIPLQWDDSHFTPEGSVLAVSRLAGAQGLRGLVSD